MESFLETEFNIVLSGSPVAIRFVKMKTVDRLQQFIEDEARSCSMDFGCITPLYVYRMWGGAVVLEEIEIGLKEIKNGCR